MLHPCALCGRVVRAPADAVGLELPWALQNLLHSFLCRICHVKHSVPLVGNQLRSSFRSFLELSRAVCNLLALFPVAPLA